MANIIKSIAIPTSILGFYRGTQEYKYKCKKDLEQYNKRLEEYNKQIENDKIRYKDISYKPSEFYYKKPYYFYSWSLIYGLYGSGMYINPVVLPFLVAKEIYRLEINIRDGLKDLKNEEEYYKVLF